MQAVDHADLTAHQRDLAADQRDGAADRRDETAHQRDQTADQRDRAGDERDQAAEQRDQAAEQRDQKAQQRDQVAKQPGDVPAARVATEALDRSAAARREAAADRKRALQDRRAGYGERSAAEEDRDAALADRRSGASERTESEHDRGAARGDRSASATERVHASVDALTGVYLRGAGLVELERAIARATRTEHSLLLAFVDVDHLKAINDSRGHAAGDRMLVEVANALRDRVRPSDLIVRFGGDEFVCALSDMHVAEATTRFSLVNSALAQSPEPGSVTVGLAELQPGDSLQDLITRADAALYRERQQHGPPLKGWPARPEDEAEASEPAYVDGAPWVPLQD